jgi:hypothetical protein
MNFNVNTKNNAQQVANDNWKAAGFINLYLPKAEGGQTKLGAIALRMSNPDEAALFSWLKANKPVPVEAEDPDTGEVINRDMLPIEILLSQIVIDFREVRTDGKRFALPGM